MTDKPEKTAARPSAKAVILDDHGRCLLLRRAMSSGWCPGCWDLPGGKTEDGETLEQGLIREITEEIRLEVSLGRRLGEVEFEVHGKRVREVLFAGRLLGGQAQLSAEHGDFDWVPIAEVRKRDLTPGLDQFFEQTLVSAFNDVVT